MAVWTLSLLDHNQWIISWRFSQGTFPNTCESFLQHQGVRKMKTKDIKGYVRGKSIFCHDIAPKVQLMNSFTRVNIVFRSQNI